MRMTFFDLVQLGRDVVLDVLGLRGDLVAKLVGFGFARCLSVCALRVGYVAGGVFGLAPGLAGSAFDLFRCSGVGDLLVAYGFAKLLFDLACDLFGLSFDGIFVHCVAPDVGWGGLFFEAV